MHRLNRSGCLTVEVPKQYNHGNVEIIWAVDMYYEQYRAATRLDPPEGGIWVDGDPRPVEITFYPAFADDYTINNIQEGSILDILLREQYTPPANSDCEEVASEELTARYDD